VSDAHLWRSRTDPSRLEEEALSAWLTAPTQRQEQDALTGLLPILGDRYGYAAIGPLLDRLPPEALPDLRLREALARLDLAAAHRFATPEQRPLLALFDGRRIDDEPMQDGRFLTTDDGARLGEDGSRTVRFDAQGRALEEGPRMPWLSQSLIADGRIWQVGGGLTSAPADRGLPWTMQHECDDIRTHGTKVARGDFDGDGRTDTVFACRGEGASLWFEPGATGEVGAPDDLLGAVLVSTLRALPRDDGVDLLVGTRGWKETGLFVLRRTGERWEIVDWVAMRVADVAALTYPSGAVDLFAAGAAYDTPDVYGPDTGTVRLVRVPWSHDRFGTPELLPRAPHCEQVTTADLDGDGRQDVVCTDREDTTLYRQLGEARFARMDVPDAELLDARQLDADPAAETWWRRGDVSWLAGLPGDPFVPDAPPTPPSQPVEADDPDVARGLERVELLDAVGFASTAALALERLGAALDADGAMAFARATRIRVDALDTFGGTLARALAQRDPLPSEARAIAIATLQATQQPDVLEDLGAPDPAFEGAEVRVLYERGTTPDPAVLRHPETTRFDPLAMALRIDLFRDGPPALAVPLRAVSDGVLVAVDLDIEDDDWAAGIRVTLADGERELGCALAHVGGGPIADHGFALEPTNTHGRRVDNWSLPRREGHPRAVARPQPRGAALQRRRARKARRQRRPRRRRVVAGRARGLRRRLHPVPGRGAPARRPRTRASCTHGAPATRGPCRRAAGPAPPPRRRARAAAARALAPGARRPPRLRNALVRGLGGPSRVRRGRRRGRLLDPAFDALDPLTAPESLVLSRARALLADGQTEPAARLLSGVIARSDSEDARLMPARVHLVRGDTDAARRTVAEVLDRGDVTTRRRVLEDDALRHLEPELTAPGVVR
jgi:hypothetical protein